LRLLVLLRLGGIGRGGGLVLNGLLARRVFVAAEERRRVVGEGVVEAARKAAEEGEPDERDDDGAEDLALAHRVPPGPEGPGAPVCADGVAAWPGAPALSVSAPAVGAAAATA